MTEDTNMKLASASAMAGGIPPFGNDWGSFYMPTGPSGLGLGPEKLVVPKDYHAVLQLCYDFYYRGGKAATVINRLSEFTVTDIRNGQRKTSDEANSYYDAILHNKPSRLMRFLQTMALEFYLSGMVLPRVDWVPMKGAEISPKLRQGKTYYMPQFDLYPPMLCEVAWAGWGQKKYYIKIPSSDVRLIRSGGSRIKEQQRKYMMWVENYPTWVQQIQNGADKIELRDVDPILRKEISISPYPTPYLFPVLEPLIFKQQLRRMDFAVASRVINAILLVTEGDKDFPVVEEQQERLQAIKEQLYARAGDPASMERLFMLFSNHTTKLEWITPDVEAMLSQDKYLQADQEIDEGLGFTRVLLTGDSRQAQASEVSTYAVQPMMEQFRGMALEWTRDLYDKAGELNNFKNRPVPSFKPIRLQDFVKTAAIFAQAFKEGNLSRTTRAESIGSDFETETELMKDEAELMKGLPAYQPTPYSPPPPIVGQGSPGRPQGSQNVPVNNRNSGVKPSGQSPTSQLRAALVEDETLVKMIDEYAVAKGMLITAQDIIDDESEE